MNVTERYEAFLALVKEIHDLDRAEELLSWDQQTYMPTKGADARASQLSTLTGLRHDFLTGVRMADYLAGLDESDTGGLGDDARVNVREIRRVHERERKVPKRLVQEMSRVQALSQQAWVEARKKADFASFAPWLEKILGIRIEIGDAVGYEGSRYDAFLDEFEPGVTTAEAARVFAGLKADLVPFVHEILDAAKRNGPKPIFRPSGTRRCTSTSESRLPTTASASCRTSTGRWAFLVTSRRTPSGICTRPSSTAP